MVEKGGWSRKAYDWEGGRLRKSGNETTVKIRTFPDWKPNWLEKQRNFVVTKRPNYFFSSSRGAPITEYCSIVGVKVVNMCPMTTRKRKVKPLEEVNEDPSKTPSRTRKRKAASIEAEDVAVDEKKIDPSSSNMTEEEEKLARLEKYGAPVRGKAVAGRDWKRRRTRYAAK